MTQHSPPHLPKHNMPFRTLRKHALPKQILPLRSLPYLPCLADPEPTPQHRNITRHTCHAITNPETAQSARPQLNMPQLTCQTATNLFVTQHAPSQQNAKYHTCQTPPATNRARSTLSRRASPDLPCHNKTRTTSKRPITTQHTPPHLPRLTFKELFNRIQDVRQLSERLVLVSELIEFFTSVT